MGLIGSGTDRCVAALTAALGLVAVGLVLLLPDSEVQDRPLPWWLLLVGFAAAEAAVVHLQVRRDSVSVSFGEIPLVLGLTFADPTGFVLANVVGSGVVLLLQRGQRGLKLSFNLCLFAMEAALAASVYLLLAGPAGPATVRAGLAAIAAVVCADLVSSLALTAVIAVATGRLDRDPLVEAMTSGLIGTLANTSVALLAVVLLVHQPAALLLLVVLLAVLATVYRAYTTLGRGHRRLELLYRFTRGVADQADTALVSERVLREARDVMQSGRAELLLGAAGGRRARALRLDDDHPDVQDVPPASCWAARCGPAGLRYPRGAETTRTALADAGTDDGLAAPLQIGEEVFGILSVADRPAFLATYSEDDLRLFQSLADHAAVALQNVALVDQLRGEVAQREHQALHDALTGLPNRSRFLERLQQELALGRGCSVVMLDIVGFGAVNDALGYDTGDRLLADVGERLATSLGLEQVARLGNDEFAALLVHTVDPQDAWDRALAVLRTLDSPFPVTGFSLDMHAQAGVTIAPTGSGTTPSQLLQQAHAALSAATADGAELAAYTVWLDQSSARRLQLVSDLRDAVASEQLTVHYQPKVDARTGEPCSVEALVRWTHPQLGRIGPDEFIPLAEHAGLIGQLTSNVLREALRQCATWRRQGWSLTIAVNLSTRSLTDADLAGRVADELARAGLPPHSLILEITESAVMSDVQRSLAVLHELRDLGVRLSVDDFGTGQSSLAYLQDLPVHELKIDKSFVQGMVSKPASRAIVQAATDLAHALQLDVVAEGVEDEPTRQALLAAGCDVLQGYLFSRPLPDEDVVAWLASRTSSCRASA